MDQAGLGMNTQDHLLHASELVSAENLVNPHHYIDASSKF